MIRRVVQLAAIAAVTLAYGCGSSPPVRYFTLDPIEAEFATDQSDITVLALGPLALPEYLDRSPMVRRGTGAELVVDELHRWAEPLGDGLHRVLARNVDGLSDRLVVVAYPANALAAADYRLVGRIDRFEIDRNGLAVLELQWAVIDADGEPALPARRDRYTEQASDSEDPAAAAAALSHTLGQFSRQVASAMRPLADTVPGE